MTAQPHKLAEKAASFPASPGVYLFKDENGKPIYVGKAKSLRNRVRSYFSGRQTTGSKVGRMLGRAEDVEFMVLASEAEALKVENDLIKRHRPRYNVRLRDDKTYSYLRLGAREQWPRLSITRRVKRDGALYYGPFTTGLDIKATLRALDRAFPLRKCKDSQLRGRDRPCVHAEMGRCLGPCSMNPNPEEYARAVADVRRALSGRVDDLLADLGERMERASEGLDFERAAQLRDQIEAVETSLGGREVVAERFDDLDAIGLYREGGAVAIAVLFVRSGRLLGRRVFDFSGLESEDEEIVSSFISQYYTRGTVIPPRVLVPVDLPDSAALSEFLAESREAGVEIARPRRSRPARLIETAAANARASFEALRDRAADLEHSLESLRQRLSLRRDPRRIECFDVSNTQGGQAVASQATFVDGEPASELYRRYNIRTVGPDIGGDVAMVHEVILRRGRRALEDGQWPDLIVIDGGRGQVAAAKAALDELGADAPDLVGLAKPNEREIARGRGQDKVYLVNRVNPVILPRGSDALFLLMRLRDEAHRFALAGHRKSRARAAMKSVLDSIKGLGPKRKKALLRRFGSVAGIGRATVEQISQVPGIPASVAKAVAEALKANP